MSDPSTVRFALLGAGLVAPFHAKSLAAAEGCELAAVVDKNRERADKLAAQFGCEVRPSYDDLLSDDAIDVIDIVLPNHLHHGPTLQAARAGKHVLCEKPPSMSLADTDEMIRACNDNNVKLGIVLNCRVRKPIREMKRALAEGRFGRLLQADAYMKWFRSTDYYLMDDWRSNRRSGAGVTIQHAFHYIDLLQHLAGPAASVLARMRNLTHPQVELEDHLMSFIEFESGAVGNLVASTALWPGADIRIELYGEDGTAVMVGERMDTWTFKDEKPEDEAIGKLGRGSVATAAGGPADFDFADHQVVIEGMAEAVRTGCDPLITAEGARASLEMALAMYRSAATGQEAKLPVTDEESIW